MLTLWVAPPEMFCSWYRINGAETNCGIAHIFGILLMNSYNTDISIFSNYYNLQSVHFEFAICVLFLIKLRWPKTKSIYDFV